MESKQLAFALGAVLCTAAPSFAQTPAPPDAGVLFQQLHRPGLLSRPEPAVSTGASLPPAATATGPQVRVIGFRLVGNTLLRSEQLMPGLAPYLVIPPFFTEARSRTVMQPWPVAAWG